jgi:AraC-like DNA-binding protein
MFTLSMARPSKEPASPSSLVPAILRHAEARGLDVEALAWRFGLPPDAARREEVAADALVPDELLHAVARAGAEPDVALSVAAKLSSRRHTLVEIAVRACPDARAALRHLARWAPLLHDGLEASLEEGSEEARWTLRAPRRPRGVGRYVHELVLAHAVHHVRAGAGDVPTTRVWFVQPRPPEIGALRAFFGAPELAFGCEDSGFAVARTELDRAMQLADARTIETIAPLVEAELAARPQGAELAQRVLLHVAGSLPQGVEVGDVARALHMSPRTLQRRLDQERTCFSELLDRARFDLASRLLVDPKATLVDVASRLGFADLATFSRAFKRWTGKPPGQWRRS